MEDSLIAFLVLFSVSIVSITMIYITKFSGNKRKKAIKTVETENIDSIVQSYANSIEVLKEQNEFLVGENKTIKKRLAAEIGVNLRQNEVETKQEEIKITEKNLEEHYEIDMINGLKLVQTMNLPFLNNMDKSKVPELMNNPMVKNAVWNYIKKNKDEMINLGVIVPKGQMVENAIEDSKETKQEDNPNGMMQLEMTPENSKYMA